MEIPSRPPNLFEYLIVRGKPLNLGDIQTIAKDLILSLQQIHSKEIVHLDLQPSNLLVIDDLDWENDNKSQEDPEGKKFESASNAESSHNSQYSWHDQEQHKFIHITNFCNSSGFTRKKFSTNQISSLYFMSPERIQGEIDTENEYEMAKTDIWSVGVILFTLVFGKPPFDGNQNSPLVKTIKKGNIKLKEQGWNENLQTFIQLVMAMLRVDLHDRLGVVEAINHEFFLIDNNQLKELEFKQQTLKNLESFWNTIQLKNQIKDYGQFMASVQFPSTLCEKIFEESEEKKAQNVRQMLNGLSYITDDLTLARFVLDIGFPEGFTDAANMDPNSPEEYKITAANVARHFLNFYENTYKNQLLQPFEYFRKLKGSDDIGTVNNCIKHAMGVKDLDPKLESLNFDELIDIIQDHLYEKDQ